MKIYRFDLSVGKRIELHNSSGFIVSRVAYVLDEAEINCACLEANGIIGYHQAGTPQLFLVVQGEGWVRGEPLERIPIKAGQAAYWEKDEWHESGTETGMTAIIIEGAKFDLSRLTPLV